MKPKVEVTFLHAFFLGIILLLFPQGYAFSDTEEEIALRVARVSSIDGPVTVQRVKDEEWKDATINSPLMAGDKIFTGNGARAEIQFDDEIILRMDEDTYLEIPILDDALGRVGIVKGRIAVSARNVPYAKPPFEIISDQFTAIITENTHTGIEVEDKGPSFIRVRRGTIRVKQGDSQMVELNRGEQWRINSDGSAEAESLTEGDSFDRWCDMRDAMRAVANAEEQPVTKRVVGYRDLDHHGTWIEVKEYGRVWRPRVTVEHWAPYRDGYWVRREPYGYIWVSNEPWGWVPYHYGRWVYVDSYEWCWVPTETVRVVHHRVYHPRPVWRPALVAFTYARHHKSFHLAIRDGGFSFSASVGWFPLGPRDSFHPWYHPRGHYVRRDHTYIHKPTVVNNYITVNNVNVNKTEINNYQNVNVRNAVTIMDERDFNEGRKSQRVAATVKNTRAEDLKMGQEALVAIAERRDSSAKANRQSRNDERVQPKSNNSRSKAVSPARQDAEGSSTREKSVASPRSETRISENSTVKARNSNPANSQTRGSSDKSQERKLESQSARSNEAAQRSRSSAERSQTWTQRSNPSTSTPREAVRSSDGVSRVQQQSSQPSTNSERSNLSSEWLRGNNSSVLRDRSASRTQNTNVRESTQRQVPPSRLSNPRSSREMSTSSWEARSSVEQRSTSQTWNTRTLRDIRSTNTSSRESTPNSFTLGKSSRQSSPARSYSPPSRSTSSRSTLSRSTSPRVQTRSDRGATIMNRSYSLPSSRSSFGSSSLRSSRTASPSRSLQTAPSRSSSSPSLRSTAPSRSTTKVRSSAPARSSSSESKRSTSPSRSSSRSAKR